MDGVLEATIALCGCKVLSSILCLPAFKQSISSVSLCCCCLLIFTDLSITVFLAYLWCSAPSPVFFHPSSDAIALRFMLFLGKTYEAVFILTPILVAVEVILCLLWHQEVLMMSENTNRQNMKNNNPSELDSLVLLMNADEEALEMAPLQKGKKRKKQENQEISFKFLNVVSFLGCLLLWCISGTYAASSWRQDQPVVRECLDKGGSLSVCLPGLLTASVPIYGQILWLLPPILVVLWLIKGLGLLFSKLAQFLDLIFLTNQRNMSQETGSAYGLHLQTFCSKWVKDHKRRESKRKQKKKCIFVLELSTEHNDTVDSAAQALQLEHNKPRLANGNPVPLSGQTGLADGCKLQSKDALPTSEPPSAAELPLTGTDVLEHTGPTLHPLKTSLWKPQWESPYLKGGLMTGLVCGLLVYVLPTVLSTNILLIRSLDKLAVCVVKHLLITTHSK